MGLGDNHTTPNYLLPLLLLDPLVVLLVPVRCLRVLCRTLVLGLAVDEPPWLAVDEPPWVEPPWVVALLEPPLVLVLVLDPRPVVEPLLGVGDWATNCLVCGVDSP